MSSRECNAAKNRDRELKWGPFVLHHRLTRGHWFVPVSDIISDYCRVCLKKAFDRG